MFKRCTFLSKHADVIIAAVSKSLESKLDSDASYEDVIHTLMSEYESRKELYESVTGVPASSANTAFYSCEDFYNRQKGKIKILADVTSPLILCSWLQEFLARSASGEIETNAPKDFAYLFGEILYKEKMSNEEAASKLGISVDALISIRRGKRRLCVDEIFAVSKILNVSPEDFSRMANIANTGTHKRISTLSNFLYAEVYLKRLPDSKSKLSDLVNEYLELFDEEHLNEKAASLLG